MLQSISWAAFIKVMSLLTILYYCALALRYYRKEIWSLLRRRGKTMLIIPAVAFLFLNARAQTADGNAGLSQANTLVRSYFDTGTQLVYGIGALVGLIGALRVYQLSQSDHRSEVSRAAAAWFGSCIFLVIVATVIKSFFGL